VIPCREDLIKLSKNMKYKDACRLDCSVCDWRNKKEDCRELAKSELEADNG